MWMQDLADDYDGYTNTFQREHATALALGLPCPFDCGPCNPEPVVVGNVAVTYTCGHRTVWDVLADGAAHPAQVGQPYHCYTCGQVAPIVKALPIFDLWVPPRPLSDVLDPCPF